MQVKADESLIYINILNRKSPAVARLWINYFLTLEIACSILSNARGFLKIVRAHTQSFFCNSAIPGVYLDSDKRHA